MRPKTARERAALEVHSLLLEGYLYVGLWKEKDVTSVYFRHPNRNRARIDIYDIDDTARLFINGKQKKLL